MSAAAPRISPAGRILVWAAVGVVVGPFAPLVVQSLAFRWAWPDLLPGTWWWERRGASPVPLAWDYVLSPVSRVGEATLNTVGIGLAVALLALLVSLPAARVLARGRFRGKAAAELFVALPLLVPETAIGLALLMIAIRMGLAGSYAGVVLVHLVPTIPYAVRMLTAVWQGLDGTFEEQAAVLGATRAQVLRLVVLPMLLPGVLAAALFAFLVSTNLFLLTFLLGQGSIVTLPTLLFAKVAGGALDATAAGIALVAALPGLFALMAMDRLVREDVFERGFGG